jgi:general secretion pathway protein I
VTGVAARRGLQRGFTLLELMVVTALIAVAVGMATLALRDADANRLEEEGARLAALFEGARARARAEGSEVLWQPNRETGIGFLFTGLAPEAGLPSNFLDERTRAGRDHRRPRVAPGPGAGDRGPAGGAAHRGAAAGARHRRPRSLRRRRAGAGAMKSSSRMSLARLLRAAGRATGRSLAGPHPLGGSSGVLAGRGAEGFTLVEVLVAVAIVAIALAAGSRAAGTLLDNSQRLSDVTLGQWCADNRLVDMKLAKVFPDVGETSFDCEEMGQVFTVRMVVRASFNPNFRVVDTSVQDSRAQPLTHLSVILPRY